MRSAFSPVARWIWIDRPRYGPQSIEFLCAVAARATHALVFCTVPYQVRLDDECLGGGPVRFTRRHVVVSRFRFDASGHDRELRIVCVDPAVGTFRSILEPPGLLVQIESQCGEAEDPVAVSDRHWRCRTDRRIRTGVPRVSCQLEWEEQVDLAARPGVMRWACELPGSRFVRFDLDAAAIRDVAEVAGGAMRHRHTAIWWGVAAKRRAYTIDLRRALTIDPACPGPYTVDSVVEVDAPVGATVTILGELLPVAVTGAEPAPDRVSACIGPGATGLKSLRTYLTLARTIRIQLAGSTTATDLPLVIEADGDEPPVRLRLNGIPVAPSRDAWGRAVGSLPRGPVVTPAVPIRNRPESARPRARGGIALTPGITVVDVGEYASGAIVIDGSADAGFELTIMAIERFDGGFPQLTHGSRATCTFAAESGRFEVRSIRSFGLRYAVCHLISRAPLRDVRIDFVRPGWDAFADRVSIETSDCELDAVFRSALATLRHSSFDTFVDCPTYEQTLWVGDAWIMTESALAAGGPIDYVAHVLHLALDSIDHNPLMDSHVPSAWSITIPAWSLLWVRAVGSFIRHDPDHPSARRLTLGARDLVLRYFSRCNAALGLPDLHAWNLLDWAPMDYAQGITCHNALLLILAIDTLVQIELETRIVGELDVDALLRERRKLADALARELWDVERGAFADSLHADGTRSTVASRVNQELASIAGLLDAYPRRATLESLVPPGTPFAATFGLLDPSVAPAARIERMISLWLPMARDAPGTVWEHLPRGPEEPPTRSYCHGWGSAPVFVVIETLFGIRPAGSRSHLRIDPAYGVIDRARLRIPWSSGTLEVGWVGNTVGVRIPAGCTAELSLPSGSKIRLRGDGRMKQF